MIRLNVLLRFDEKTIIRVGQLAEDKHQLYFQYDRDFLTKDLWLSPYKLPLQPEIFEHKDRDFSPVFGLFDDSLPDGWGLLLMDRFLFILLATLYTQISGFRLRTMNNFSDW